jgi:peptide/nickel transport system permease protein
MLQYIVKRLLALIPLGIGVTLLVFLAMHFVPGDPVLIMLGIEATEELAAQLRADLGLDRPLPVQYLSWLGRLLRGDLGKSIITGAQVKKELISRLGVTVQLTILGVLLSLIIAIPLGVFSAIKQNSWADFIIRIISLGGISLPGFAIGILLILFTSRVLGWSAPLGFVNLWDDPGKSIQILIMPVISLGTGLAASVSRMTRSSVLEVLRQDYTRTARAKGISERKVIYKHVLKNALIPILTLVGLQIGMLLGGAVVIEEVFALPGAGRLLLTAINTRDYPVVMACVLVIALGFALVNTIVDLSYAVIDPRIRYQ